MKQFPYVIIIIFFIFTSCTKKQYTDLKIKFGIANKGDYISLGKYYLNQKNFESAKEIYSKCLSNIGFDASVMNELVLINIQLGHLNDAEKILNKLLKKKPDYFKARINKGILYEQQGRFNDAIRIYSDILQDTDNLKALINRGVMYSRIRKYSLALFDFQHALDIEPENYVVNLYYGNINHQLSIISGSDNEKKKYEKQAVKYWEKSLNINPKLPAPYNQLALYYKSKGDVQKADYIIRLGLKNVHNKYKSILNNLWKENRSRVVK